MMQSTSIKANGAFFILGLAFFANLLCNCSKKEPAQYNFKVNESFDYSFMMTQQVEPDGNRDIAQRLVITLKMRLKTLSIDKKGAASIEISFNDVKALLSKPDGREPLKHLSLLDKASLKLKLAKNGRILDLAQEGNIEPGLATTVISLMRSLREMLPTLPERLSKGTAWSRLVHVEEDLPPLGMLPSRTKTMFEVLGSRRIEGYEAMEFRVSFDIEVGDDTLRPVGGKKSSKAPNGDVGEEPEATMSFFGKGGGRGKIYFDSEMGRFIAAEYETVVDADSHLVRGVDDSQSRQVIRSRIQIRPEKPLSEK